MNMHRPGRKPYSSRILVEDCRVIDATYWMRQHVIAAGSIGLSGWFRNAATGAGTLDVHYELYTRRGEPVVRVIYCPQQEGQPVEHDIGLQTTSPYRGGVRWWFMCPLQRKGRPCGRRVQKLYLPRTRCGSAAGTATISAI